jgi:hypothetical protein
MMASTKWDGGREEVSDLLNRLHLTTEEEDVIVDSDEEAAVDQSASGWSVIGKVLSPKPIHISTILRAMKAAWGNPKGCGGEGRQSLHRRL